MPGGESRWIVPHVSSGGGGETPSVTWRYIPDNAGNAVGGIPPYPDGWDASSFLGRKARMNIPGMHMKESTRPTHQG